MIMDRSAALILLCIGIIIMCGCALLLNRGKIKPAAVCFVLGGLAVYLTVFYM